MPTITESKSQASASVTFDEPVVDGVAVVLSSSQHRLRTLCENKASFDIVVDWR